jgi:hypothetical protein
VSEEERGERDCGKQEAVEHHGADVHLGERDLAEEKAASPEGTCEGAGGEAKSAILFEHGTYAKVISAEPEKGVRARRE